MAIQGPLLGGFPALLAAPLGFLTFPIHAKKNFSKKKPYFTYAELQTHNHTITKSMHNHSTNSCFVIILIHLGIYNHSS